MASPVKTVSTATATMVVVGAKTFKMSEVPRAWLLVCVKKYLGIEPFALCRTVCRSWNGQCLNFLKKPDLRFQYAHAFFRLLWIDYFNRMPTDKATQELAFAETTVVRAPVPQTASWDELSAMNGSLWFFDQEPLSAAERKFQAEEFAIRYGYFQQFVVCLTDLVQNCTREEFIAVMQQLAELRETDRLQPINDVIGRWNALFAKEIETTIPLIQDLSGFVPVKTPESCCVIL